MEFINNLYKVQASFNFHILLCGSQASWQLRDLKSRSATILPPQPRTLKGAEDEVPTILPSWSIRWFPWGQRGAEEWSVPVMRELAKVEKPSPDTLALSPLTLLESWSWRDSNSCPWGFPGGTCGREHGCQHMRLKRWGFNPWVGKIPWRRAWQSTPGFLPGESHEQRSLTGYSPWGSKESDTTEATEHACGHTLALKKYINGETMMLPTCCHCWRWLGPGMDLCSRAPLGCVYPSHYRLFSAQGMERAKVWIASFVLAPTLSSVTMLRPVSLTSCLRNTSLQLPPPSCLWGKGLRSVVEEEMPALRSQAFRERCRDKANWLGVTQVTFLSSGWMRRLHWNR